MFQAPSADIVTLSAFSDEMAKIADVQPEAEQEPKKKGGLKTWLKNTALVGAGTAVGTGAGMLAEKLVKNHFPKVQVPTKAKLLTGVAGGATVGGMLLKSYMQKVKNEKDRE